MSKQLEKANLEQFQNEELQNLAQVSGGANTSTTCKKTVENKNDTDSSAECNDSIAAN